MSFIVTDEWLKNRLENYREETVVIDVQFNMDEPAKGRSMYEEEHIQGAIYLDLNKDLSGPVQKHGGGHPLPDVDVIAKTLGNMGINQDLTVVVYDQNNGMFAGRAWWLLHYLGHERVYILDGGLKRWKAAGNSSTDEITQVIPSAFSPNIRKDAIVDMVFVKENIEKKSAILIDSRARNRYLGNEEHMYEKAGHIPGAKNLVWQDVLNDDYTFKDEQMLTEHFSSLPKEAEIIVSCGSGVSACPNIIALKELGYKDVKLYPGSFSDWISYDDNELETKES